MKKKLNWQAKGVIISVICVPIFAFAHLIFLIPAYDTVGKSNATVDKQLQTSQVGIRIISALFVLAIISVVIFVILELIRSLKDK